MNILGTSQNDIDRDFNFFFVDKHNMIAAFQWLCNFFLNKDLQCVVTLFF